MPKPLFVQKPDIESIDTLFNNQFSIPVFQRPYSWEEPEINDFFKPVRAKAQGRIVVRFVAMLLR